MSFSHAEDLDIVAACLKRLRERGDLPYVGLIGSKTKWATFRHRLEERGFTAGTGAGHLPDRRARHHRQGAGGDRRGVAAQLLQLAPPCENVYTLRSTGRSGARDRIQIPVVRGSHCSERPQW